MNEFHQAVLDRVMTGIDDVPLVTRADIYHGIAELFMICAPEVAAQAAKAAHTIRDALNAQFLFNLIVSDVQARRTQQPDENGGLTAS